jgi:hypothetical protein
MAGRCTCTGCATDRHGAYTVLLHSAQNDTDPGHRQQAMDVITLAMPYSHSGADALAAPALDRLYPEQPSQPPNTATQNIADIIGRYRAEAQAIINQHIAKA